MFSNQYEEHMAHSAPCNSRWDGFDRGDSGRDLRDEADLGQRAIGRLTSEAGFRVEVIEQWCDDLRNYQVWVGGDCVFDAADRERALTVGRWWLNGCPV